jgi:hypothetical protein
MISIEVLAMPTLCRFAATGFTHGISDIPVLTQSKGLERIPDTAFATALLPLRSSTGLGFTILADERT